MGKTASTPSTTVPVVAMETESQSVVTQRSDSARAQGSPDVVDGSREFNKGSTTMCASTGFLAVHRCLSPGVGGHLEHHLASGMWNVHERRHHINWLELQAVFLSLKKFEKVVTNRHVLVNTDNVTVVAYINKMGGHVPQPCVTCCGK